MKIIVTGAGKGIGFEICRKFAISGDHEIIAIVRDHSKDPELSALSNTRSTITPLTLDLGSEGFESAVFDFVKTRFSKVDILLNNAGYLVNKTIENLNANDFDEVFKVNLQAPFLLIKALLPLFESNAHILNIGSMGGYMGSSKFSGLSLYSASKGALAILSECLAEELKPKNVRVNCLALGSVETEMFRLAFPGLKASMTAPEAAAIIVNYALNGEASFTGQVVPVTKNGI